ncbi:MAG TPA: hypothetical protein VGV67_04440, partial [Solirubrobacteraceae bacterium]|nr:hypothetical protein [Solirubrobacteraceae bacterium]
GLTLADAGTYRVYADFKRDGRNETLARDVNVAGPFAPIALAAPSDTARAAGGYAVGLGGGAPRAGEEAPLTFELSRGGRSVTPQPYLGARGHLVALRASDLAYLHVHPTEEGPGHGGPVSFATEFATGGSYRLFLQFKHDDRVRTAAFTKEVAR